MIILARRADVIAAFRVIASTAHAGSTITNVEKHLV